MCVCASGDMCVGMHMCDCMCVHEGAGVDRDRMMGQGKTRLGLEGEKERDVPSACARALGRKSAS